MTLPAQIEAAAASADAIQDQLVQTPPQDTSPAQEPVQNAVKPQTEVDEARKLQDRYNSLRGKYDAEVPRLNQTVKDMEARLQALSEENQQLREAAAKSDSEGVTDNDVDIYGEDMTNYVGRVAKKTVGPLSAETARMRAELEDMKAQVNAAKRYADASAEREFTRVFDEAIPNWREQNEDPEFLAWLKQPIPGYGVPRQVALNGAVSANDAHQAVEIFKDYLREKQQSNGLARQVQPDYTRRSAAPAGTVPQVWTQAKVADFYARAQRGEFTTEQYQQLEKELNDALVQNHGQLPSY